jgi:hypothetical protein
MLKRNSNRLVVMKRPKYFFRALLAVIFLLCYYAGFSQNDREGFRDQVIRFHAALTDKNADISSFLEDSLSYGHSNGWIETKKDFIENFGRKLIYHTIGMDSLSYSIIKGIAHVRFVGNFDVSLDGKRNVYRLKVLEVWVKRNKSWKILARQAVR